MDLKKGKNLLMIKCGNGGGPWQYSVAVTGLADYAFLKGPRAPTASTPTVSRPLASRATASPDRGKGLFFDLKGLACSKCHVVGGEGGAIGPELSGIAARYPREELVQLDPLPVGPDLLGY